MESWASMKFYTLTGFKSIEKKIRSSMANATKKDVVDAVEKIYKVVPKKVNMCKIPRKAVGIRRGKGFKGGGKKAIVYLKKRDKIEFV